MTAKDTGNGSLHEIQQSCVSLKALTVGKYFVCGAMIAEGLFTANPLLVAGGVILSQMPTGKVVNRTDYYIAMTTEHSEEGYGNIYLAPHSTTYTLLDNIITPSVETGVSVKTATISNVIINSNSDVKLSFGTKIINKTINIGKDFLDKSFVGQKINQFLNTIIGHKITTEPYGTYKNKALISEQGIPEIEGFSSEVKRFANLNKEYIEENGVK